MWRTPHYIRHMTYRGTPEDVALRIQIVRKSEGITLRNLARLAGLEYAKLRRKLKRRPHALTLGELLCIADAAGRNVEDFMTPHHEMSVAA